MLKKNKKQNDIKAQEAEVNAEDNLIAEELQAEAQAEVEVAIEKSIEEVQQEKIATLEAALIADNDRYLRLQAEFQNYRKRMARENSEMRSIGVQDALSGFVAIFDHFNLAVRAAETSDNMAAVLAGLKMIQHEYDSALGDLGVTAYHAVGEKFSPELHDAAQEEASETVPAGVVIKEWFCGYKMGDKVLRPAKVVVSTGKPEAEVAAETTAE